MKKVAVVGYGNTKFTKDKLPIESLLLESTKQVFDTTKNIYEEYEKNGLQNNHELVPESMVHELCIAGTPNECKIQLKQFRETGIDLPIIQFNPTDNVKDSFDLVTSTFSEESN